MTVPILDYLNVRRDDAFTAAEILAQLVDIFVVGRQSQKSTKLWQQWFSKEWWRAEKLVGSVGIL